MMRTRQAVTDQAIREAARNLLVEVGYAGLTIEGVAARAGVAKTTIYRRWPSKAELVFAAAIHSSELGSVPDTGVLRQDLAVVLRLIVRDLTNPAARAAVPGMLAEMASDRAIAAAVRARFIDPERQWMNEIVNRAIARGELAAFGTPERLAGLLLDLLLGAIFSRLFLTSLPADEDLIDQMLDFIVPGLVASCQVRRPQSTKEAAS